LKSSAFGGNARDDGTDPGGTKLSTDVKQNHPINIPYA
jgi:hypothetical protein